MRFKFLKEVGLALALVFLCAAVASASGNLRIGKNVGGMENYQVQDRGGGYIDPTAALSSGMLQFFRSTPSSPLDDSGAITEGGAAGQYSVTTFSDYWEYFFKIDDRPIVVRAWSGAKTSGPSNFYAYQTMGYNDAGTVTETIRLGPASVPSYQWIKTFQTVYQAMPPYTPIIDRDRDITESMVRDHYTEDVELTMNVGVNADTTSTPPRQLSASSPGGTKFSVEVVYPDGSTETKYTNGSINMTGLTQRGLYKFRARAHNWFGASDWSSWVEWETLGDITPGVTSITVDFVKPTGDLGVNTFALPFSTVSSPGSATNLKELVEIVNTEAGENIVSVAGWWDQDEQKPAGYIIEYNSATVNDFGGFTKAGNAPDDPATVAIESHKPLQFSVTSGQTITFVK
jgi:hypothetical protein